jgi:hypothetical protein
MKCMCNFETDSFDSLRKHFSSKHHDMSFLDTFYDSIESNWQFIGREHRRLFLLKKAGYECSQCKFSKTRTCGSTILEIDHIDGNHQNNEITNLRVLCPNCHAMTPKYRNWNNPGNKKYSIVLRPGNKDYDKRLELKKERKALLVTKTKIPRAKKEDEMMIKLKEIKQQYEEDFKNEVIRLHASGEIDFSKYGWVQILAYKMDEQPQVVGRRVRKLLPDFFVEHCFTRKYNLYRNKQKEKEKVDKSIVSE